MEHHDILLLDRLNDICHGRFHTTGPFNNIVAVLVPEGHPGLFITLTHPPVVGNPGLEWRHRAVRRSIQPPDFPRLGAPVGLHGVETDTQVLNHVGNQFYLVYLELGHVHQHTPRPVLAVLLVIRITAHENLVQRDCLEVNAFGHRDLTTV